MTDYADSTAQESKIDGLLAQSEGLVARLHQNKRYKRDLTELREAAIGLATSNNRLEKGRYDDTLHLPGFDASALYAVNQSMHMPMPYVDVGDQLDSTDIEGFLANYHDTILLKAHTQAKAAIEDNIRELHIGWASADWNHAREAFANPHSNAWTRSHAGSGLPGNSPEVSRATRSSVYGRGSPLNAALATHAQAVHRLHVHNADCCSVMEACMTAASATADTGMNSTQVASYRSWLALLGAIVSGEQQGAFALHNERDGRRHGQLKVESGISRRRAREFLEREIAQEQLRYCTKMTQERGLEPCLAGNDRLHRSADVATYVHALHLEGLVDLHEGDHSKNNYGKPVPLWPLINFCLCSGDFEDALAEVRLVRQGDMEYLGILLETVVDCMVHQRAPRYSAAELQRAFDKCVEWSSQNLDQYQAAVLRLLTDALNYTAEEYETQTWSMLWFEEWSTILRDAGVQSINLCTRDPFTQRDGNWYSKLDLLIDHGDNDTSLLRDYVDLGAQDPTFDPVLHMLALHRFGPAVDYLRKKKMLFAATHILVISLHYGLVAPHDPLDRYSAIPTHPREILDLFVQSDDYHLMGAVEMTDYVMSLYNHKWMAKAGEGQEETRANQARLAAQMAVEHMLSQCARIKKDVLQSVNQRLREYPLSATEVNDMLRRAGHHVYRDRDEVLSAMELYQLAGNVARLDIVELLCTHLSAIVFSHELSGPHLPPHAQNMDLQSKHRRFWLEKAQEYYHDQLGPELQGVSAPLRRCSFYLKLLMDMGHFAELFYEGKLALAVQVLDRPDFSFLPTGPGDVQSKVHVVEEATYFEVALPIDSFLKTVMRCLLARRQEMNAQSDVGPLQARARGINTLAGQIRKLSSETTIEINRLLDRILV